MFIKVENLEKKLGGNMIFSGVNLMLSNSYKYGVIGKNGSGKSTFLKILTGIETQDKGKITIDPPNAKINYFSQFIEEKTIKEDIEGSTNVNLREVTAFSYLISQNRDLFKIWEKMIFPDEGSDISALIDEYTEIGGYEVEGRIFNLCKKYGINPEKKVHNLSGGQKTRLQIIKLQLYESDILLLDEPTNHLDQEGIQDFYDYVAKFKGIILIASHDRNLLSECVDRIILFEDNTSKEYSGNYEKYYEQKIQERISAEERLRQNEKKIEKLNLAASKLSKRIAKHVEKKRKFNIAVARAARLDKKNKARKTRIIQAKLKLYKDNDKMQSKNLISRQAKKLHQIREVILDRAQRKSQGNVSRKIGWSLKLDFDIKPVEGDFALKIEDLSCGYDSNVIVDRFNLSVEPGERVAIVGPNGAGKSTLLKTVAGIIPPIQGKVDFPAPTKIGYLDQENLSLNIDKSIIEEFLSDATETSDAEARSFLHFFLFEGDMPLRKVKTLSEGEKVKLKLAKLLYSKSNLLLLDEPTNHLDLPSQEVIEKALKDFPGTIILITHDKTLIRNLGVQKKFDIERKR